MLQSSELRSSLSLSVPALCVFISDAVVESGDMLLEHKNDSEGSDKR